MPSQPSHLAFSTHWLRILVLWLCGILAAMQFAKISFGFLALQQAYAVSAAQVGFMLSTVGVVGLLMGVTVGLFAHALGYRRLLLLGLGLGTVLAFLQSLMPPFALFFVTRVLEGASHLAVVVAAPTLIAANCAPRHRSIAMGLWSTFMGVAFALTAAVGAGVLARYDISGLLRLHAAGMLLMFAAAWWLVPADAEPQSERTWPRLNALAGYHRQIYTRLETSLPGLCFFCYTGMAVALLTFIPQQAGNDKTWLSVVLPFTGIVGSFCAGWLAQYWISPLSLVRVAFGGVGLSGMAVLLSASMGAGIAFPGLALMFSAGLAGGAAFSLIPYLSDENLLHARANGAVAQMGNVGSTLGPPLFAALIARMGVPGLVLPVVVFSLAGIAIVTWGARRRAALGAGSAASTA